MRLISVSILQRFNQIQLGESMNKLVTALVAASFLLVGAAGIQAQDNSSQKSSSTSTQTPKKCHKHHCNHHKKTQTAPSTEQKDAK
jgi:Ni/Co efflux regulator RcnB